MIPANLNQAELNVNERLQEEDQPVAWRVWMGRTLTGLAVAFLVMDATVKVLRLDAAVEATTALGYTAEVLVPLGLLQLALLALYLVPRTAVLGAILWTGYLGGAVASQLRVGNPLLSNVFVPLYIAALLWGGLWLRDRRARQLLARP